MLSSLQALNAAATAPSSRSAAFQPKVKPRPRKGAQENNTAPAKAVQPAQPEPSVSIPVNVVSTQESVAPGPVSRIPSANEPAPQVTQTSTPPPSRQHVPKLTAKANPYGPVPPVRPARERPPRRAAQAAAEPTPTSAETEEKAKKRRVSSSSTPRKRRVRDVDEEIDPTRMTMKEIIQLADAKEKKKQKEEAAKKLEEQQQAGGGGENVSEQKEKELAMPLVPQVEIVDGKLVINQQSMQIDARALNTDDVSSYRRIEESSSKLNYHSYMKKVSRDRWKPEETERFYKAVQQFGTDFAVIERIFPGKSRSQIKAKYKKEERCNSRRLSQSLFQQTRGDTTYYEELVNQLKAAAADKASEEEYNFTWDVNADGANEEETAVDDMIAEETEDYANGNGSVVNPGTYEEEVQEPILGDKSSPKKEESPKEEAPQVQMSTEMPKTEEKKTFPLFAYEMEEVW